LQRDYFAWAGISVCALYTGHYQGHPYEYHHHDKDDHNAFKIRDHGRHPEALVVRKHRRSAKNLALQTFVHQVAVFLAKSLPAGFFRFCGKAIGHFLGRAALDFPTVLLVLGRFKFLMVDGFCLPARIETAQNVDQARHNQQGECDTEQNSYENN
jgi:hypothetical protein